MLGSTFTSTPSLVNVSVTQPASTGCATNGVLDDSVANVEQMLVNNAFNSAHDDNIGANRTEMLFELASLQATKTHEPDRAIEGMLKILDYEPTHGGAVAVLERLRRDDPSTELPVMRGLRPYYHRVEDREKEAEAMEVLLQIMPDQCSTWREEYRRAIDTNQLLYARSRDKAAKP